MPVLTTASHIMPYLALTAHPAIGAVLLDPRPAWVWNHEGNRIIWSNAAGLAFFQEHNMQDLLDRTFGDVHPARRHLARLAMNSRLNAPLLDRLRFFLGVSAVTTTCLCKRLEVEGESMVLVLATDADLPKLSEEQSATRLVEALSPQNSVLSAIMDGDSRVLAASSGFESLVDFSEDIDSLLSGADEPSGLAIDALSEEEPQRIGGVARMGSGLEARYLLIVANQDDEDSAEVDFSALEEGDESGPYVSDEVMAREADIFDMSAHEVKQTLEGKSDQPSMLDHMESVSFAEDGQADQPEGASAKSKQAPQTDLRTEFGDSSNIVTLPFAAASHSPRSEPSPTEIIEDVADSTITSFEKLEEEASLIVSGDEGPDADADTDVVSAPEEQITFEAPSTTEVSSDNDGFDFKKDGGPYHFVWESDEIGRFSFISKDLADSVGPDHAAIVGKSWAELAERFAMDEDGQIAAAFAARDTWTGLNVNWPVQGQDLAVPVELTGLPVFGRFHGFQGFRGFGICRNHLAVPLASKPVLPSSAEPSDQNIQDEVEIDKPADIADTADAAQSYEDPLLSDELMAAADLAVKTAGAVVSGEDFIEAEEDKPDQDDIVTAVSDQEIEQSAETGKVAAAMQDLLDEEPVSDENDDLAAQRAIEGDAVSMPAVLGMTEADSSDVAPNEGADDDEEDLSHLSKSEQDAFEQIAEALVEEEQTPPDETEDASNDESVDTDIIAEAISGEEAQSVADEAEPRQEDAASSEDDDKTALMLAGAATALGVGLTLSDQEDDQDKDEDETDELAGSEDKIAAASSDKERKKKDKKKKKKHKELKADKEHKQPDPQLESEKSEPEAEAKPKGDDGDDEGELSKAEKKRRKAEKKRAKEEKKLKAKKLKKARKRKKAKKAARLALLQEAQETQSSTDQDTPSEAELADEHTEQDEQPDSKLALTAATAAGLAGAASLLGEDDAVSDTPISEQEAEQPVELADTDQELAVGEAVDQSNNGEVEIVADDAETDESLEVAEEAISDEADMGSDLVSDITVAEPAEDDVSEVDTSADDNQDASLDSEDIVETTLEADTEESVDDGAVTLAEEDSAVLEAEQETPASAEDEQPSEGSPVETKDDDDELKSAASIAFRDILAMDPAFRHLHGSKSGEKTDKEDPGKEAMRRRNKSGPRFEALLGGLDKSESDVASDADDAPLHSSSDDDPSLPTEDQSGADDLVGTDQPSNIVSLSDQDDTSLSASEPVKGDEADDAKLVDLFADKPAIDQVNDHDVIDLASHAASLSATDQSKDQEPAQELAEISKDEDLEQLVEARDGLTPTDLSAILDKVPAALIISAGQSVLYSNSKALGLLGFDDQAQFEAAGGMEGLFGGRPGDWLTKTEGVSTLRRQDGTPLSAEAKISSIQWQGEPAAMLSFEEARADAPDVGLSEEDQKIAELEAILDTATDGVVVLDERACVLRMNHSAEALFEVDRHEMAGESFLDLLAEESHKDAIDYLDGLVANGVASVLNDGREVIGRVSSGGLIPLFMTMGRVAIPGTNRFCAVVRDIAQWKRAEEDLLAEKRRAEKANNQKSDFLAKISHEIRTPLNAIIGFSEVMMDERFGSVGNDRYKDYLKDIHTSGSHIMSLINDLLDLSKVEAGKMDLSFQATELNALIQESVGLMQPQANREQIIIRTSLASALPDVVGDARSLRQIILNLLSNGVKYTPAGGQVIISTSYEENGEVILRIRDTGIGMSEEEVKMALEPFRQVSSTASKGGQGTGLGLPLTKALVEANRAQFSLVSAKDHGTLVEITFPNARVLAS